MMLAGCRLQFGREPSPFLTGLAFAKNYKAKR